MLANLTAIQKHITKQRPHEALGQGGLFAEAPIEDLKFLELPEFPQDELLWRERVATGAFLTGHPLDRYRDKLVGKTTHVCREGFDMLGSGTSVRIVVAGLVRSFRRAPRMAFVTLEDHTGTIDVMAFSEEADRYAYALEQDSLVALQLKPKYDNDRSSLRILKAHQLGRFGPFKV